MPKCTIDGKEIEVAAGDDRHPGRRSDGHRHPPLLLAPRPARGRQLPHVPGRDREDAQAADRLQHDGHGGHGGAHREREGGAGPPHHAGVPARQPPHRLPGVRPGRRVLPAGPVHGARPARLARWSPRRRSRSARWWTSGPIMLDAERCVLCIALPALRAARSRAPTASSSGTAATTPRSRPSRTGPSPTTTRATWPTSARWARCSPTTSASRCGSGSWRRRTRSAPAAPRAATSSWTTATARCTACARGGTSRSTSPGCATSAAWSTRRSPSRRRVTGARVKGASDGQRGAPGARPSTPVARRLAAGAARPPPSWPRPRPRTRTSSPSARWPTSRGHARLPGRATRAGTRAGARGRRPAAGRPQPEHAGLPRPGPGPNRRGRDPGGLRGAR